MTDRATVELDTDGNVHILDQTGEVVLVLDQEATKDLGLDALTAIGHELVMENSRLRRGIREIARTLRLPTPCGGCGGGCQKPIS